MGTSKDPFYWSQEGSVDELETAETNEEIYEAYNEWIMDAYVQYTDEKIREKLKSYSVSPNAYIPSSQKAIDEFMVEEGLCPSCLGTHISITNDLLLSSYCEECKTVFNVPEDMQGVIEVAIKEVKAGTMDFKELTYL